MKNSAIKFENIGVNQIQIAQASCSNTWDIILLIIIAIYYSCGESQQCGIQAGDYIVTYFLITSVLILYRGMMVVLTIIFKSPNQLLFSFTLSSFYICIWVFYIFFLIDFFSPQNNCDTNASYLWCAMIAMCISAFSLYIVSILEFVNFILLLINNCGKMF